METIATPVTVFLPAVLRVRAGGASSVQVEGATVDEVINALDNRYPGLGFHLRYETGELRPFVNVFVNGVNVRFLQGLTTPVAGGAQLHILPSVAGG